jgi:hypothetical protein
MDVTQTTIDDFQDLDASHLTEAVRLFDAAIHPLIEQLAAHSDKATPGYDEQRDRLCTLLTLRKVHEARLIELTQQTATTSHPLATAA